MSDYERLGPRESDHTSEGEYRLSLQLGHVAGDDAAWRPRPCVHRCVSALLILLGLKADSPLRKAWALLLWMAHAIFGVVSLVMYFDAGLAWDWLLLPVYMWQGRKAVDAGALSALRTDGNALILLSAAAALLFAVHFYLNLCETGSGVLFDDDVALDSTYPSVSACLLSAPALALLVVYATRLAVVTVTAAAFAASALAVRHRGQKLAKAFHGVECAEALDAFLRHGADVYQLGQLWQVALAAICAGGVGAVLSLLTIARHNDDADAWVAELAQIARCILPLIIIAVGLVRANGTTAWMVEHVTRRQLFTPNDRFLLCSDMERAPAAIRLFGLRVDIEMFVVAALGVVALLFKVMLEV